MAGLKSCTVPSVGLNEGQRTYFFLLCLSYSLFLAQRSENLHSRCTDSFDNSVCFREEHPESNWSHKMARVLISDTLLTQFLHRVQASILSACVCVSVCVRVSSGGQWAGSGGVKYGNIIIDAARCRSVQLPDSHCKHEELKPNLGCFCHPTSSQSMSSFTCSVLLLPVLFCKVHPQVAGCATSCLCLVFPPSWLSRLLVDLSLIRILCLVVELSEFLPAFPALCSILFLV